jgi:hypothetical protein
LIANPRFRSLRARSESCWWGDSFVKAAQVPIAQKLQTLLAADLNQRFADRKFDAVELGFSGTGQANQLPFYERNRDLKLDLY